MEDELDAISNGDEQTLVALGYTASIAAFLAALSATDRRRARSIIAKDKRRAMNRLGNLVGYQTAGNWPRDPVAVRALATLWFRDSDLPRRIGSAVGSSRALSTSRAPIPSREVSLAVTTSKPLYNQYRRIVRAQKDAAATMKASIYTSVFNSAADRIGFRPLANSLVSSGVLDQDSAEFITKWMAPKMQGAMLSVMGLSAETAGKQLLAELPTDARLIDVFEAITPWAINHTKLSAEDFTKTSHDTIMYEAARAVQLNLNSSQLSTNLQRSFGLTPRQAGWVHNFVENLDDALPGDGRAMRYANKLLEARLDRLTRTETMTAFNYGRQIILQAAQERGVLSPAIDKVWVTGIDEKVCPVCRPMDGRRVPLGEQFLTKQGRVMVPPVHPNCRCTIIPSNIFDQGIISRDARAQGFNLTNDDDYALAKHKDKT